MSTRPNTAIAGLLDTHVSFDALCVDTMTLKNELLKG